MPNLGILGGTFNPIHWGHLLMAEAALDQGKLDQIIWVPAHHPPHRSLSQLVDVSHRIEMVRRAIAPHPAFQLSTVDCDRPSPSYAIDTLTDLQHQYPHSQWYWILGLDAFQTLPQWYRRPDLVPQCQWLVAPRPFHDSVSPVPLSSMAPYTHTVDVLAQQGLEVNWQILEMPRNEISSSLIRQYRGDRRSIRYLVPDCVFAYINRYDLYRK